MVSVEPASHSMVRPAVSIVMPARNAAATISDQLAALSRQELDEPWELVIVDNGSTDGTRDSLACWAERLSSMRIATCAAPGANSARNAGVRAARADRILLCDADDVVAPGWAVALSRGLDEWDLVGGATDTTMLNDASAQRSRPNPAPDNLRNAFGFLPYAIGANMGFQRRVFDNVGGFDEAFRLGGDEIDFCWRAQYAGFRIGFVRDAVVHYRFKQTTKDAMRQAYVFARGDAQLYAKHCELGHLRRPSTTKQMRMFVRGLGGVARVDRIIRPKERLRYTRSLGRVAGRAAGLAKYRVVA